MAMITGLFRLGRDAEIRYTSQSEPVANLALAFNYGKKDNSGNRPTQWIDASLYGKRVEALAEYLTKGTAISATLQDPHIRTYDKNDGTQGFALSARVLDLELAGSRSDDGQRQPRQAEQQRPAQQRPAQQQAQQPARQAADLADMDDDIPF